MGVSPMSLADDFPSNVCNFTLRHCAFAPLRETAVIYGWFLAKARRRKDRKERMLNETIGHIGPARRLNAENANSSLCRDDLSAGCDQCRCHRDRASHSDLR